MFAEKGEKKRNIVCESKQWQNTNLEDFPENTLQIFFKKSLRAFVPT